MLLSIDESKVQAEIARAEPAYRVTAVNLILPESKYPIPSITPVTAVMTVPLDLQKASELLLEARRRLIEKGDRFLSPEELEREIDDIRGR